MATIQLRRHVTGGQVAPPATLNEGEPFFNLPGFTGSGPNSLWIDTGTALIPLVDSARQVEVAGAQTVTGAKTFSTTTLRVTGGVADNVLITDGAGNLRFGPQTPPGGGIVAVNHDATMTGDGDAVPLSVIIATAALRGAVNVPAGSALTLVGSALGMAVASGAQIAAGADPIFPITSLGLRGPMGADVAALQTTAKTVVPAINELNNAIANLTGNLVFGGTYDVATNTVTPSPNPINPIPQGDLPPATAARRGWYLICTSGGPPVGPVAPTPPSGTYTRGDWLICDATPAWVVVEVGGAVLTASNVNITTIPPLTATNVQDALSQIVARSLIEVATDGSLFGLGTAASPLSVDIVDGGSF
jgi:hypothetical protein